MLTDDTSAERTAPSDDKQCACGHYSLTEEASWVAMVGEAHTDERCGHFREIRARPDASNVQVWWRGESIPEDWK